MGDRELGWRDVGGWSSRLGGRRRRSLGEILLCTCRLSIVYIKVGRSLKHSLSDMMSVNAWDKTGSVLY